MYKLEVQDLHKRYGSHEVLKGVSLKAAAGDVISIIGSSGSGKSTLLRCVNFLESYDDGEVRIEGELIGINVAVRAGAQGIGFALPIDEVKINRHFIAPILTDPRAANVARGVIDLAGGLGLTTIAEGIENAETADWLREHGCHFGQGIFLSPPVASPQLISLLKRPLAE